MQFSNYELDDFYDEMFAPDGMPRSGAALLAQKIETLSDEELQRRKEAAELALLNMGITFNAYGQEGGTERIFPFDIIPRIISASEWERIERGLQQRIVALNLFIDDVYHTSATLL